MLGNLFKNLVRFGGLNRERVNVRHALKTRTRNDMLTNPGFLQPGSAGRVVETRMKLSLSQRQEREETERTKTYTATLGRIRVSAKKMYDVVTMLKGMSVDEAMLQMQATPRKPAKYVFNLLHSVRSNALFHKGLEPSRLVIRHLMINKDFVIKGIVYHAKGRSGRKTTPYTRLVAKVEEWSLERIRRVGTIGRYGKKFVIPVLTGQYQDPFKRKTAEDDEGDGDSAKGSDDK